MARAIQKPRSQDEAVKLPRRVPFSHVKAHRLSRLRMHKEPRHSLCHLVWLRVGVYLPAFCYRLLKNKRDWLRTRVMQPEGMLSDLHTSMSPFAVIDIRLISIRGLLVTHIADSAVRIDMLFHASRMRSHLMNSATLIHMNLMGVRCRQQFPTRRIRSTLLAAHCPHKHPVHQSNHKWTDSIAHGTHTLRPVR